MEKYDHKKIEASWQKKWKKSGIYQDYSKKEKFYCLDMFPYPSGSGLHVGHPKGYIATDVSARFKMLNGYSVLHPMGWDAFGLPAENYAIKTKTHPRVAVKKNIATFKKQLEMFGFTYDWEREINTTDPNYYKWTQWIFLQLYKNGLAYESDEPVNWCPSCKTVLANEDLEGGACERCGTQVIQKKMRQWVLKMTDYADRLLADLDKEDLNWEEQIKEQQRNWIGRSEGINFKEKVKDLNIEFEAYDSIPQTFLAQTFTIIAPEHPMIKKLITGTEYEKPVMEFVEKIATKKAANKFDIANDLEGIFTGRYVDNPFGTGDLPIWVASYVLANYGTGIVNCSAHDERDFVFAKKYGIPLKIALLPNDEKRAEKVKNLEEFYREPNGIIQEPKEFKGMKWQEAREPIIDYIEKNNFGVRAVNYKMRDWVFSRQRYWGEPIPMLHCETCKNKKYKYVLLHGYIGSPEANFFSWLKSELEKEGHSVFCPDLPNTEKPNVDEQVNYVLKNITIDKNTIILGHSLGGAVALKIIEKAKNKIARVILVNSFINPNFRDHDRPYVKNSFDWKFDIKKIRGKSGEIIMLIDGNYPIIKKEEAEEMRDLLRPEIYYVAKSAAEHFCAEKEPEIMRMIKTRGTYALTEKELPLKLPDVKSYEPTGTGESPLAAIKNWVNVKCPHCGGLAKRETNTMPQWAGSSWYYLAYIMRGISNFQFPISKYKEEFKKWLPVSLYVGGAEHATRHLLYARFWHKFLYDIGAVSTIEPFKKLVHVGLINGEDGRKMSKRWGNVINPDEIINKYGADAIRLYEMFMGPFTQNISWSTKGVIGVRRFLERTWDYIFGPTSLFAYDNKLFNQWINGKYKTGTPHEVKVLLNKTIKKVGEDIENFRFNTAISQLMILRNSFYKIEEGDQNTMSKAGDLERIRGRYMDISDFKKFLILLAPFAPHMAEELWSKLGNKKSIFNETWPKYDVNLIKDEEISLVLQVNGKVRETIKVSAGISEEEAKKITLANEKIKKWIAGKEIVKIIYVSGKIVNIVVK